MFCQSLHLRGEEAALHVAVTELSIVADPHVVVTELSIVADTPQV